MIIQQDKSFSQTLNNPCNIPLSQLPKPCLKRGKIFILNIFEDDRVSFRPQKLQEQPSQKIDSSKGFYLG